MLRQSILLLLALSCCCSLDLSAQLVINEVSSTNSMLEDAFERSPDWIELHNTGSEAVELDDYYLSDQVTDLFKWQLPDLELGPDEYIVFFAEGDEEQSDFHFNFAVSSQGETLYLMHEQNGLAQDVEVPALRQNDSYGYSSIANDYRYFDLFTAGAENNQTPYLGYSEPPVATVEPGIYDNAIEVDFDTGGNALYVATDGSFFFEDMQLVTDEILVSTTTSIRARAQQPNYLPSEVVGASYIIAPDHELPILCLGVDPYLFFDEEIGLHSMGPDADPEYPFFGANFWKEIEIPASLEYFVDGERVVNQTVGVEIHGGKSSRTQDQKPLRLTAKEKYGKEFIEYPVFATKPQETYFNHWVLRNSGADFLMANYRDAYWHEVAALEHFDIDRFGFQPTIVYINGEYWGIMNIREKVSPTYFAASNGANPDSLLVMEKENHGFIGDSTIFDPLKNFIFDQDLSIQENFDYVASQIDMNSYMDYFILEIFSGNPDWPANNVKYWKPSITEGKWRYVLYDLDTTLLLYYFLTYDFDIFDWIYGEKSWAINAQMFINLMENEEFKRQFINRFADYMNTRLNGEHLAAVQDSIANLYEHDMEAHFNRWNGSFEVYEEHTTELIPGFYPVRHDFVRSQITDLYELEGPVELIFDVYPEGSGEIQLNTLSPELPFSGIYFNGNAIDLSVTPAPGKRFLNWHYSEGPVEDGQFLGITKNFPSSGTITAVFEDASAEDIVFFSNPTESYLNGTYRASGTTHVRIYSPQGQLILDRELFHNEGEHLINLALTAIPAGVYLFEVVSELGKRTKRFVKL